MSMGRFRTQQGKLRPSRSLAAAVLLLASLVPAAVNAGSFGVNPVSLTIPAGTTSTSLVLENRGEGALVVQAELLAWSQKDGKDALADSSDLIVSPPIVKVAPGASQTIRVGLMRAADPERELTYRLFLQEIVPPPAPNQTGVNVALRIGMPIFVLPRGPSSPQLAWDATRVDDQTIRLALSNSGNAHARAIDCRLVAEDGSIVSDTKLAGYVLQRQTRAWEIPATGHRVGGVLKLDARTDRGPVSVELTLK